jgi:nicotinamidase-related amidase
MVNCFEFDSGEIIKAKAEKAAHTIRALRDEIEARGWPVIYVNDNFGQWHSECSKLIEQARQAHNPVLDVIAPTDSDFFIIKPQFSGFYATNLPVLLPKLGVTKLILTGIATDICVLFTAADAHMRDYALWIPADAVAAETDERGRWALEIMSNSMGATTDAAKKLSLGKWLELPET